MDWSVTGIDNTFYCIYALLFYQLSLYDLQEFHELHEVGKYLYSNNFFMCFSQFNCFLFIYL